jgi:hypothetical protein
LLGRAADFTFRANKTAEVTLRSLGAHIVDGAVGRFVLIVDETVGVGIVSKEGSHW